MSFPFRPVRRRDHGPTFTALFRISSADARKREGLDRDSPFRNANLWVVTCVSVSIRSDQIDLIRAACIRSMRDQHAGRGRRCESSLNYAPA
jgi:hypothetical protein